MYLVSTDDNPTLREFETMEEVKKELIKAVIAWTEDDCYVGKDGVSLYKECLKDKDFGDIASVYEVNSYFCSCGKLIPCELHLMEKDVPTIITRIM